MSAALTLLQNSIHALFCYLLYTALLQKKVGRKKDWGVLTLYVITVSSYMVVSRTYIGEPYRSMVLLIISWGILSLLLENKKAANFAVVLFSFAITRGVHFVSIAIAVTVTYPIPFANEHVLVFAEDLSAILIYLSIGLFLYHKFKSKLALSLLQEKVMWLFVYALGVTFLFVYLYFDIRGFVEFGTSEITLLLVFFASVVSGALIVAVYQVKRYKERLAIIMENRSLKAQGKALKAEVHTVKKVVPAVLGALDEVLAGGSHEEIKRRAEDTKAQLSLAHAGGERTKRLIAQRNRRLPKTGWILFNQYFRQCNARAVEDGILLTLDVHHDVAMLDGMGVSQTDVLKVFADHVDNAFKEAAKLRGGQQGMVHARFVRKTGGYEISILDNAPPFPLDVLANLGRRGVSTNGTGEGFFNTLQTLAVLGASLIVWERAPADECYLNKQVTIRFDGQGRFKIESYRADEIKALAKSSPAAIEYKEPWRDKNPKEN